MHAFLINCDLYIMVGFQTVILMLSLMVPYVHCMTWHNMTSFCVFLYALCMYFFLCSGNPKRYQTTDLSERVLAWTVSLFSTLIIKGWVMGRRMSSYIESVQYYLLWKTKLIKWKSTIFVLFIKIITAPKPLWTCCISHV